MMIALILTAELLSTIISFILKSIFLSFVFFFAGRIVTGENTTYSKALLVAIIGSFISEALHWAFRWQLDIIGLDPNLLWLADVGSALITIIVYIPFFMKFFNAGFWGALAIGMFCVILYLIIGVVNEILRRFLLLLGIL
ncbi:MAG: hypothetical protein ACFFDP_03605 [Promethearchaeota archaeon]